MRIFWEKTGVLLPIYRLAGQGFSEAEIASKVNTAERDVHSCIAWLLRFLNLTDRGQLIQYASRRAPRLAL
jgi:DNA-binding NarL/FixJ family response regulator